MKYIRDKYGYTLYCIRDDGTITDKHDCKVIGHLKEDRITDKFDLHTLYRIRSDGTITDKFDYKVVGHIREDGTITDKYDLNSVGSFESNISSTNDNSTGCLSVILSLLWEIISFIFVLVIPFIFVYWAVPMDLSLTWVGYIILAISLLFATQGLIPLAVILMIPFYILNILFIPYYICTIAIKIKTKCSRIEMLKLFWKWFLKGPLAYPKLVEIMALNNVLPRTTQLLNKIIGFVSRKFKKTSV